MMNLFKGYTQFINWVAQPKTNGKTDKIPVCIQGNPTDPMDPRNQLTIEEAHARAALTGLEVGFVFTEQDPFFFVDIDEATIGSEWSPLAKLIVSAFPGCAIEISQSRRGLHIFGTGSFPGHRCRAEKYGLEFYTSGRFVALTGTGLVGDSTTSGQPGVNWLVQNYFQPVEGATLGDWTNIPCENWCGPEDDEELLKRAKKSKSTAAVFGSKASFYQLWMSDSEALGVFFPSTEGRPFDHSSADAALSSHLAFYTGKNCERMERLFSMSELGKREKWIDREDYRKRTILAAVSICKKVYNRTPPTNQVEEATQMLRPGNQFLDLNSQITYFKGCTYVISKHRVFVPEKGMLKPEQFRSTFGGYQFAFALEGKSTKNAFEVFTESQLYAFPKVQGTCFRPKLKAGSVLFKGSKQYVNTYFPIGVARTAGDASRFLEFLAKILPDERDRTILLSYMAACVQYPGHKFQWTPLLQGVQGNGKSFLATAVSEAVGEEYSHFPNASDLSGNGLKFTGWMHEKLFIGIEEIYTKGRMDLWEHLKDKITNKRIEMQNKGSDQFMGDNCANFFLLSNHKDAVTQTKNDRRVAPFYSSQQTVEDITSCGMGGQYFPSLYSWAETGGFAIITNHLMEYTIPTEFNPATLCHRAPTTTSTKEALSLSLGTVEQEILEAIEEGRPGFRGGWVSSIALDTLLTEKRRSVALNKRRDLLMGLGYIIKERTNTPSALDGMKKPRLFITTKGETAVYLYGIPSGAATKQAYEDAQRSNINEEVRK